MASSLKVALSNLDDVDFFCTILKAPSVCSCFQSLEEYSGKSTFHFRNERSYVFLTHPPHFGYVQDLNEFEMLPVHESILRGNGKTLWIPCIDHPEEKFCIDLYPETQKGMDEFPGYIVKSISDNLSMASLKKLMDSHVHQKQKLLNNSPSQFQDKNSADDYILTAVKDFCSTTEEDQQVTPEVTTYKATKTQNAIIIKSILEQYQTKNAESLDYHVSKKMAATNSLITLKSLTADEIQTGSRLVEKNEEIFQAATQEMIKKFEEVMDEFKSVRATIANAQKTFADASKVLLETEEAVNLDKEVSILQQIHEELKACVPLEDDKSDKQGDAPST